MSWIIKAIPEDAASKQMNVVDSEGAILWYKAATARRKAVGFKIKRLLVEYYDPSGVAKHKDSLEMTYCDEAHDIHAGD